MSGETTGANPPAESQEDSGHLGVLATWRQTPGAARALLAGVFVNRLAGFLTIFLVLFLAHRGFSNTEAGFALGTYAFGGVVGTIIGGYLSDRLSARAATLVSMGGSALLLVSIIYLKIYWLILVAVLLISLVGLVYRPAAQVLITEMVPQGQLVMVMAMYRLALNLGTSAAPFIGIALVEASYTLLFWAEAGAALVYGLIALRYLPRKPKQAEAAAEAATAPEAAAGPTPRGGYLDVLRDWRYVFYLTAVLLVMIVYTQYTASLPLAIKHAGQSIWWYGTVVTINAVLVVAFEVPITRFVQTWPIRVTAIGGFGLIAVGYAMYGISLIPALLVIGTLIWTLNEIIGAPTTFAYPGMAAPAHLRGRYFGSMQSMVGLGSTLGPVLGVLLFVHQGNRVWWYAAGLALVSTVCALIGMRLPGKSAATEQEVEAAAAATIAEPSVAETAMDEAAAAEAVSAESERAQAAAEAETTG